MARYAARGAAVLSSRRWIQTHGDARYRRVLARMPRAAADGLDGLWATSLYPLPHLHAFWRAFRQEWDGDEASFVAAMRQHGSFIANDNLNGVLQSVLTFVLNPEQLFRLIPRLFGMYFKGVEATVDTSQLARGAGTCTAVGFSGLDYISPVICGWAERAFEEVGGKSFVCTERHFGPDNLAPDPLVFDLHWQ